MIAHCVMLRLAKGHDAAELSDVMAGLRALVGRIEGYDGVHGGANIDAEGKSPDVGAGFVCHFRDRAALDRYAADPRHRALGARLVALCDGGAAGIVVYDIEGDDP